MQDPKELRALSKEVSDKSRKAARVGRRFVIPRKFDNKGVPLTQETFDARKHLKLLDLDELRFLHHWRGSGWDVAKAILKTGCSDAWATKTIRKVQVFKDEDERIKALADVPTPDWIAAKHVENVHEAKLDDSQRDSLKELAKITGAYKQQNIQITNNVFNLPELSADQEAKLKAVYDTIAIEGNAA